MPTTETNTTKPNSMTTFYGSDTKDKAIDNIWKVGDDVSIFHIVGNNPKKMDKKAGNVLISRGTKMQGEIVYFLPKDKDGKLTGSPVRYLSLTKDGVSTGDYIPADKVVPNTESTPMLASNFTALDDINSQMNKYGANGGDELSNTMDFDLSNSDGGSELSNTMDFDLSNADGLDESLSNMTEQKHFATGSKNRVQIYDYFTNESLLDGLTTDTSLLDFTGTAGIAKALKPTGRFIKTSANIFYKDGNFKRGTTKRVVDVIMVNVMKHNNRFEKRNMLIFSDGTAGAPNKWENISSVEGESNFTDVSLLDGLTENTSLLNADGARGLSYPSQFHYPKNNDSRAYRRRYYPLNYPAVANNSRQYSNLVNESLLDGLTENTSHLQFTGKDAKGLFYPTTDNAYSNLTNESLIDNSGTITNRSLIDMYSNFTNESMLDADGEKEKSGGISAWFKGLFGGKKKGATEKIADPNVSIVDSKTMNEAYQESGSGKSFKDWVNSDGGKGVMNSITQLANLFVNRPSSTYSNQNQGGSGGYDGGYGGGYQGGSNNNNRKSEMTILGMSPVTFGIIAIGVIAIGAFVAVKLVNAKHLKVA